jgi:hypothetical protein
MISINLPTRKTHTSLNSLQNKLLLSKVASRMGDQNAILPIHPGTRSMRSKSPFVIKPEENAQGKCKQAYVEAGLANVKVSLSFASL